MEKIITKLLSKEKNYPNSIIENAFNNYMSALPKKKNQETIYQWKITTKKFSLKCVTILS